MESADDTLTRALGDVLTEHLMREDAVTVEGLGTFRRVHRASRVENVKGDEVMMPPSDVIEFDAS